MQNVLRGDVILCDLNPVVGTEQAGIRPVLIIQIDSVNKYSHHTIVIPFTTKIKQTLYAYHVLIPTGTSGLSTDSVLLCEQIKTIDTSRLLKKLGKLESGFMNKVELAIKTILGFK